jgi:ATP synthase protein I
VKQDWKGVGSYGTVGIEVILSVLVGFFAGYWLDRKFETNPWLTLIGFTYGVAAAARALYRAARRATKEAEDLDQADRDERKKYQDGKHGN